jgi:adenylate cyclase
MDRRAEAVEAFERALSLDPRNYDACLAYARFLVTEGDDERAAEYFLRAMEAQPDDCQAPLLGRMVFARLGRAKEGREMSLRGLRLAEEALRAHPESSRPAQLGASVLAAMGEKEKALDWLNHSLAIDPDDLNSLYNAACTYAQLGEAEPAMAMLEKWAQNAGGEYYGWLQTDVDLDSVREHPRYSALLETMRQRAQSPVAVPAVPTAPAS